MKHPEATTESRFSMPSSPGLLASQHSLRRWWKVAQVRVRPHHLKASSEGRDAPGFAVDVRLP